MTTERVISLGEAADRLGVHYMTAYRYVRLGRLPARREGREWRVRVADLDAMLRSGQQPAPHEGGRTRWDTHRVRLLNRLVAADEPGAMAVVEAAIAGGATPEDVYMQLLAPVLHDIGDRWEDGSIDVAQEHAATSVAIRVVARLGPRFSRRGRRRGTIVLACARGETHWLPSALLADVLRGAGWRVIDLGSNTPAESVLDAVRAEGGDLACVGVSLASHKTMAAAKHCVAALHDAFPRIAVLVGGPAVKDGAIARRLGADGWAPDAVGVVDLLVGGVSVRA